NPLFTESQGPWRADIHTPGTLAQGRTGPRAAPVIHLKRTHPRHHQLRQLFQVKNAQAALPPFAPLSFITIAQSRPIHKSEITPTGRRLYPVHGPSKTRLKAGFFPAVCPAIPRVVPSRAPARP